MTASDNRAFVDMSAAMDIRCGSDPDGLARGYLWTSTSIGVAMPVHRVSTMCASAIS
jgi:hypothetical protein